MNTDPLKARADAWIAQNTPRWSEWCATIWDFAETAWREYRSAAFYVDLLKSEGFEVEEGTAGMPTAFCARWSNGPGPVLGGYAEYDAIPGNAAIMHHKGVLTSINSDSADLARRLYQEAAKTIKYGGLTDEEALRFITLNPAKQIKMDGRIGSIDVGKDADLAIFNAHPFSIYARVEMTLIEGEVYFDRKEDLKRRELIAKEKKELIEKERRTTPQEPQRQPAPPVTPTVSGPGPGNNQ